MKRLLLVFGVIALAVQLFGQKKDITGSWWSPKGFAGFSYEFDSGGVVKFHSFTCMSEVKRTGHYIVSRDSIFITYDPLTAEEKFVYGINVDSQTSDTLLIIDSHKIRVNEYVFIYDQMLDKTFTLSDSVFEPGLYLRSYQILFDSEKFTLRPESYPFLDSLADFLKSHGKIKIEIAQYGTADGKRSVELSERCAMAIQDYLIAKGINQNRLTARGFGNSNPIWSNGEIKRVKTKQEKEKLRQLNRRTEFRILRTDFVDD